MFYNIEIRNVLFYIYMYMYVKINVEEYKEEEKIILNIII